MSLVERYRAYAADFERTFADDDWSRLKQYFTEDATYSTPANGLRVSGREADLALLGTAAFKFDRRFATRSLSTAAGPHVGGGHGPTEGGAPFNPGSGPALAAAGA